MACTNWSGPKADINIISDDEGDDTHDKYDTGRKQCSRLQTNNDNTPWPQVRARIQHNQREKRNRKRIEITHQEYHPPSPKGNQGRRPINNTINITPDNVKERERRTERLDHHTIPAVVSEDDRYSDDDVTTMAPNATIKKKRRNLDRANTNKIRQDNTSQHPTILHPSGKYNITRAGKRLRIQIKEKQPQRRDKNNNEICDDSNQPSPTGNLGRTSKGRNVSSAIYSSPKGNLGRRLQRLAD